MTLTLSQLKILNYLRANGMRTQKEIINEVNLPIRSARYSLKNLEKKGLITVSPNLMEMRSVHYSAVGFKTIPEVHKNE